MKLSCIGRHVLCVVDGRTRGLTFGVAIFGAHRLGTPCPLPPAQVTLAARCAREKTLDIQMPLAPLVRLVVNSGQTSLIDKVQIGTARGEELDERQIAELGCKADRRASKVSRDAFVKEEAVRLGVHICTRVKQLVCHLVIPMDNCEMKGRLAVELSPLVRCTNKLAQLLRAAQPRHRTVGVGGAGADC